MYSGTILKDRPTGHKNMVSQDRWSLLRGSAALKCGPSVRNVWSFKTGGLSRQVSLYILPLTHLEHKQADAAEDDSRQMFPVRDQLVPLHLVLTQTQHG